MTSTLLKIDTCEAFLDSAAFRCYGSGAYLESEHALHGAIHIPNRLAYNPVDGLTDMNDINQTYWLLREAYRIKSGEYKVPFFAARMRKIPGDPAMKYWYHFPHQSLTDQSMIAFTPSHEYGLRDRQVIMKVGKYLTKYYADVLSEEEIRDIANMGKDLDIQWAEGDSITGVYLNGPTSCMAYPVGEFAPDLGGIHPTQAYTYKYEDGTYEFALAYLRRKDQSISARCMCSNKHKVFTRHYGDDGPILETKLVDAGYKKVDDMSTFGLRLRKLYTPSGRVIMPYLDGEGKGIKEHGEYWEWNTVDSDHTANESEAVIGWDEDGNEDDNSSYCQCCDNRTHNDDLSYSDYHEEDYCDYCLDRNFAQAIYNKHGDETWISNDDVIFCESDDNYYLDTPSIRDYYELIQVAGGDIYKREDCVQMLDGDYEPSDHEEIFQCGEDQYGDPVYDYLNNIDGDWLYSPSEDEIYHAGYAPNTEDLVMLDVALTGDYFQEIACKIGDYKARNMRDEYLKARHQNQTELPILEGEPA